jgi:hypothetical protein
MPTSPRRSPQQKRRRAEILAAASGWSPWPRRKPAPAPLPAAAKAVLADHGNEAGQCRAGCGPWPCDTAIQVVTGGAA